MERIPITKEGFDRLRDELKRLKTVDRRDVIEAIKDAAAARLRPILMTSFSTVLGILPIALALGAGSESRVSMGIAVIGGLIFSTFLTLLIVPAVYSYFSRKTTAVSNVTEQLENEEEPVLVSK